MELNVKLAERIVSIISKLNLGEQFSLDDLVTEFGVDKRTIQRDINERLSFLPLKKINGVFSLEPVFLGRLSKQDIRNFASLVGVSNLFPKMDSSFITSVLSQAFNSPYLVKAEQYEANTRLEPLLKQVERVISKSLLINFYYKDKQYCRISPYKLISQRGVWYLAAVDHGQLKSFALTKITLLVPLAETFISDPEIIQIIDEEEGIYFGKNKFEVVLRVDSDVAHYFKRRQLLPEQVLIKELEHGDLLLSSKVVDGMQIVPLIKRWMPNIEVISPNGIRQQIIHDIHAYLAKQPQQTGESR
ncbi:helix-turn-helix transcriptional regulator [Shewanella colwelliana]|uniref:helix-turn-helix transcriptional regulator n=1 Tax=Shewanella colwelliana TaxID=23 RepID=UPI0004B7C4C6|nr:WYL domain-containing protein [Shewanella colwelliana]